MASCRAITWTKVDFSLIRFYSIHLRAIVQATFLYDKFEYQKLLSHISQEPMRNEYR